jgi:chromosome segregation ATPase
MPKNSLPLRFIFYIYLSLFTVVNAETNDDSYSSSSPDRLLLGIIEQQETVVSQYKANPPKIGEEEYQKAITEIIQRYEEYIKAYKEDVLGHILYGKLLNDVGRYDHAYDIFLMADKINNKIAVVKESLGLHLARKAKYQESIAYFFEAIELKPRNPRINFGLAETLGNKGDVKQAQFYFKQAIRLKPDNGDYYFSYGEFVATNKDELIRQEVFDVRSWEQEVLSSFYEARSLSNEKFYYGKRYARALMEVESLDWSTIYTEWKNLEERAVKEFDKQEAQYYQALSLYRLNDFSKAKNILDEVRSPSLWEMKKELMDDIAVNAPNLFSPANISGPQFVTRPSGEGINKALQQELESMVIKSTQNQREMEVIREQLRNKDRELIGVQTDLTQLRDRNKNILEGMQTQAEHFKELAQNYQEARNELKNSKVRIVELEKLVAEKKEMIETVGAERPQITDQWEQERLQLVRQIEEQNKRIQLLESDKFEMASSLERAKLESGQLTQELSRIQEQLRIAQKNVQNYESNGDAQQDLIQQLRAAEEKNRAFKLEFETKFTEVFKDLSAKGKELNLVKKLLSEKESELSNALNELEKVSSTFNQEKADWKNEVSKQNEVINSLQQEKSDLQAKLSQAQDDYRLFSEKMDVLQNELQVSRRNIEMAKSSSGENAEMLAQLDAAEKKNSQIKAEFEQKFSNILKEMSAKTKELEFVKSKLLEKESDLNGTITDLTRLRERNQKLMGGVQQQADQFKELIIKYQETQNLVKNMEVELFELRKQKQEEGQPNAEMEKLNAMSNQVRILEERLESSQREKSELLEKISTMDRLQRELEQLAQENKRLAELREAEKKKSQDELARLLSIIEGLKGQLVAVETDLVTVKKKYAEVESRLQKQSQNTVAIAPAAKAVNETMEMINSLEDSINRPFVRMEKLNSLVSEIQQSGYKTSDEVAELLSEIKFLKSDLDFSRTAIDLFYDFLKEDNK